MREYNRKIDIIIPAYNVPDDIFFRCLSSIACQTIIKEAKVTIVDDASTKGNYQSIANHFKKIMKIDILRLKKNGGPGVARQYGLDHTSNGYVTFIDADDTLNGPFALRALREAIEKGNHCVCSGVFDEMLHEHEDDGEPTIALPHEEDFIWMFGKLYKRQFIDKYKIHFHPTSRANEDNGFNTMIKMCAGDGEEEESIIYIPAHVYCWHENLNSITRINDCQYTYGSSERDSFYGFVENMIYALKETKDKTLFYGNIIVWTTYCMVNLYAYYLECYAFARQHADKNLQYCKRFYNEIYKEIEPEISYELIAEQYNEMMKGIYANNKLNGFIPHITFQDFMDTLKVDDNQFENVLASLPKEVQDIVNNLQQDGIICEEVVYEN